MNLTSIEEYVQVEVRNLGFEDKEINELVTTDNVDVEAVYKRAEALFVPCVGTAMLKALAGSNEHATKYPDSVKAKHLMGKLSPMIPVVPRIFKNEALRASGWGGLLRQDAC